jgi:hypothetical protein
VAATAPMVSHLLFADDSLLFFRVDRESADAVMDVLNIYCQASGQRINTDKSSIHFVKGVSAGLHGELWILLMYTTRS